MQFFELFEGVKGVRFMQHPASEIRELCDDSRRVQPGDLFVAIPGTKVDGRRFISDAISKGAVGLVLESGEGVPSGLPPTLAIAEVPSARKALSLMAANRYHTTTLPILTAITGTNGKTTTTYLVEAILAAAGRRPGVIGTIGYRFGGHHQEANLTTPGPLELHAFLHKINQGRGTDAVLEASSIALDQGRLDGCRFRAAAMTNVTQDHLDYHGTMERYFEAKTILFRELLAGTGVVFSDDDYGQAMARECVGRVLTVSRKDKGADVVVQTRQFLSSGIRAQLLTPIGPLEIASPLVGEFNLSNLLLAVGIALVHEIPTEAIVTGISRLRSVPGRLQALPNDRGVLCVVDYAHTPDALVRALDVLRPLTHGRLICVLGCGGDRDHGKRPLMGVAAARRAQVLFVTSDNPRTEDPRSIINMIVDGIRSTELASHSPAELANGASGYHVEPDRRTAIEQAIALAQKGDVVLLAGKGHEDYQILGTEKIHFDDREVAAAALASRRPV
jgi:UDP-N-acetylmuramoyl-L-alanyl-D-glutamate--2,6-diaminopimelate ligase